MSTAIILVALCASIFGVFYMFFTTRNRERMAMIEKGVESNLPSKRERDQEPRMRGTGSRVKLTLKTGMLFVGVGLGFVLSVPFAESLDPMIYPLLVVGIVFTLGGIGLVTGFLVSRFLDRKDSK